MFFCVFLRFEPHPKWKEKDDLKAGGLQACQLSRFQCKSNGFTATQANLMGSPLPRVNTHKCHSNDANDADFIQTAAWCWADFYLPLKRAACLWDLIVYAQVVQGTLASIEVVSDSIFLQWVWLATNSIGATPSLKVFGQARLAGLDLNAGGKISLSMSWNKPLSYVTHY